MVDYRQIERGEWDQGLALTSLLKVNRMATKSAIGMDLMLEITHSLSTEKRQGRGEQLEWIYAQNHSRTEHRERWARGQQLA
jgi:hypothetical protein